MKLKRAAPKEEAEASVSAASRSAPAACLGSALQRCLVSMSQSLCVALGSMIS